MVALFRKLIAYKFFPLCWTLITVSLLCIPGSLVPGDGLFSIKHLDKIVHVLLFGSNVLFWGWHYSKFIAQEKLQRIYILIAACTILLGIMLEFIQRDFIPNRSFDGYDIVANAIGAVSAAIYLVSVRG